MAKEISMNGRKTIERIQREFTEKFNYLVLIFLDENMRSIEVNRSLAEVRTKKGPDISIMASLKVNTLEQRFKNSFGIIVEVAYYKDGKVMHTKESVNKTLSELNQWCEKIGCDKFVFKKTLVRNTLLSTQEQLFKAIKEFYADAEVKKINKDNFLDIYIPSIHSKRGSHLFFNTAKNQIKLGFYVRDEDFINKVMESASNIERYAQGLRIFGNPAFLNVKETLEAAIKFLSVFSDKKVDSHYADITPDSEIQEFQDEQNLNHSISHGDSFEAINELEIENFTLIHTLVILYSAFANESGITDSTLDVLLNRLELWDLEITADEKNKEIMRALKWFNNNYEPSLFSKLKLKLNELTVLDEKKRKLILYDLRLISATFFSVSTATIQLFDSIIKNFRLNVEEYGIESVTEKLIEEFNSQFNIEYKSDCLLHFRDEGSIVLLSIDVKDLKNAIKENDFSKKYLHRIGKVNLGDWESIQKLTSEAEVAILKKDFKKVKPSFIVVMYCQGIYVHALSSDSELISVKIGNQTWMAKNLDVEKFRNGDPIPEAKSEADWEAAGENGMPAWCYYENLKKNGKKYGKLYNWYAVNDQRGLAPEGWRVASQEDWIALYGNSSDENSFAISIASESEWGSESAENINSTGFSALPAGLRYFSTMFSSKFPLLVFNGLGVMSSWWTSTYKNDDEAFLFSIDSEEGFSFRKGFYSKSGGFSVRCIDIRSKSTEKNKKYKNDTLSDFEKMVEAYKNNDSEKVAEFIKNGNPPLQFNMDGSIIENELIAICASQKVDIEALKKIIKRGTDLNVRNVDSDKYTAVHYCAWDGKIDALKLMLENGALPDIVGADGRTPLHLATALGHIDAVQLLLRAGVDLDRRVLDSNKYYGREGATALREALINQRWEIIDLLLEAGAEITSLTEPCVESYKGTNNLFDVIRLLAEDGEYQYGNFNEEKLNQLEGKLKNYRNRAR